MNKAELINDVAERLGDSKQKGEEAVNAVFEAITAALKRGDDVRLPSFGVFAVSETQARMGRNPQTKEPVQIPAGRRPRFRAGKALKEALN
ncbi:MAG: HU family DNA-binding protein [Vitreimonas sp.]